ncbi:MAG: ATP synthase F1 subunit delta [Acidobacteriota bacterium]
MHVGSKARRYARALAQVSTERGLADQVQAELEGLAGYLAEQPVAKMILEAPASTSQRQGDLVRGLLSGHSWSEPVANFIQLLAENRGFGLLDEVVEGHADELRKASGVVQATVRTARALPADQLESLKKAVAELTSAKNVELLVEEDPSLIAGVVTEVGSVVHDGSLKSQLSRLREQLASE